MNRDKLKFEMKKSSRLVLVEEKVIAITKKLNKYPFLKFVLAMQFPIYVGILWIFIQLGFSYWVAYVLTNQIYILIMFPLMKFKIFNVK